MKPLALLPFLFSFLAALPHPETPTSVSIPPYSIATLQPLQTTRNELIDGLCKRVIMIFGRGSTQPGNVGELVGPSFFDAMTAVVGSTNIAIQGVDYPATDMNAMLGGSAAGAAMVVNLTTLAASKCPDSQVVLSGYSEGAEIIHLAGLYLGEVASSIKAVVVFGDLLHPLPIPNIASSIVKSFCAFGDEFCNHPPIFILPSAHTSYDDVASQAATFLMEKIKLSS